MPFPDCIPATPCSEASTAPVLTRLIPDTKFAPAVAALDQKPAQVSATSTDVFNLRNGFPTLICSLSGPQSQRGFFAR